MNLFKHLLGVAQFHGSHRLISRKYRFLWVVTLLLCLCGAINIIMANVLRYTSKPTYLIMRETAESNIQFPSVVICPEISYPQYKIESFLSGLKYPTGLNESYIESVIRELAAFYSPDTSYSIDNVLKIENFLDYNNISVESASRQMTLSCEETILRCRYLGEMMNCSSLFTLELTNFGFCCTFNGRSLRREIKLHGVHNVPPPPVLSSDMVGHTSGLMIVVNSSQKMDNIDLDFKWMYLARGQQFVESNKNGTPIAPNAEFWFAYYSERHVLNKEASNLSPELRHCRKVSEKLQYFPSYLRQYCMIECEMQRTMERCLCVKFTHPKPPQWKYCTARSMQCVENSAVTDKDTQCNCDKTCDTTSDLPITMNFPLIPGNYILDPLYEGLDFTKVTIVRAFIQKHRSIENEIRTYVTKINLFSQIGGTLNVFFGSSILTLIEVIQLLWYGVRHYWIVKRTHRQRANVKQRQTANKIDKIKKKRVKFQKYK